MLYVLLLFVLLFGILQVARRAVASWFVSRASRAASLPGSPSPEIAANLRRAMQFDPDDPRHPALLARALQYSLESSDISDVLRFSERAAALGPHHANLWADLGAAYEWAGRDDAAQRAYAQAFALFPNSPEINWRLGNYALRSGRLHEAAGFLRVCVLRDAALRRPAFDLAWRASGDATFVLEEIVPPDSRSRLAYLDYLADTARLDAAADVWARLRDSGFAFDPAEAFHYFDALLEHRRCAEIESAWSALAAAHPARIPARGAGGNLLVNGDFESEPADGGLDWRVATMPGVELRTVTSAFYSGTHSLEIRFLGTENVAYGNVRQFVPVEPNTRYRFTGHLRAEGITTDSGPRLQIYDLHNPATLAIELPAVLGSSSWSAYAAEFVTGPQTTVRLVRVLREPSGKFLRQFRGTVWVDNLSLVAVN
ncbi:MAG: tetratricopeptide repeat protein [Acidobacteria bacterium]|nr:tetratricopeptide repeat protein [Acidobacteriota bacterium]